MFRLVRGPCRPFALQVICRPQLASPDSRGATGFRPLAAGGGRAHFYPLDSRATATPNSTGRAPTESHMDWYIYMYARYEGNGS
jgi:hypothetical protein